MKTLQNKEYSYKGKPLLEDTGKAITTFFLLTSILEGSVYQNSTEIIKATLILAKLKVEDGKINIEDADYEFIKKFANVYQPIVSKGLMFAEFYQELT
jgi:hypothetical protein